MDGDRGIKQMPIHTLTRRAHPTAIRNGRKMRNTPDAAGSGAAIEHPPPPLPSAIPDGLFGAAFGRPLVGLSGREDCPVVGVGVGVGEPGIAERSTVSKAVALRKFMVPSPATVPVVVNCDVEVIRLVPR